MDGEKFRLSSLMARHYCCRRFLSSQEKFFQPGRGSLGINAECVVADSGEMSLAFGVAASRQNAAN